MTRAPVPRDMDERGSGSARSLRAPVRAIAAGHGPMSGAPVRSGPVRAGVHEGLDSLAASQKQMRADAVFGQFVTIVATAPFRQYGV